MTFDQNFRSCVRYSNSPSLAKYWVFVNTLQILILAGVLCGVFYWILPDVGMSVIAPLALAGALIAWYEYMMQQAARLMNKVR